MSALLKSVPPSRTPERSALAAAIERHEVATKRLVKLKAALTDVPLYGDGGAYEAETAAEAAVAEAKASEDRHLAAIALGEKPEAENPVTIAERALSEARARVAALRKTRDALETQVSTTETEIKTAKYYLDKAVAAVMRDEGGAFINQALIEAGDLQKQLSAKRAELNFLKGACFDSVGDREAAKPISDFMAAPAYPWEFGMRTNVHPAIEPWHQAREALTTDPDSPLPV